MIKLLQNTFSGKKVFLTGHTGFKGSWMAFILNHLGAQVRGYALAPEEDRSLYDMIKVETFTDSVIGDVLDSKHLDKAMLEFKPDFVFHFAAQSLVIRSYDEPSLTYNTNVMGSINAMEALRKLDIPCVAVMVTTDKVYENIEKEYAYKENDKLGGFDPYSSSKAAMEIACASYRKSFFNPDKYDIHQKSLATARSGNVIGGGDWSENRIIPDLIRAAEKNEALELRNPSSVRPWQHLLDPLSGYLLLAAKMHASPKEHCDAYNFGPDGDVHLTVRELVEMAHERLGKGEYITSQLHQELHEAKLLHLDVEKAKKELNWSPSLNADEAISMTIDWYRDYHSDPFGVTFKQVVEYFSD